MNKWLSCVAALFLFGCASERVVLLPSPEGGKSAVVLRDANGEQELSQPYAASVRRLGLSHPYQASAEEVQARYGATLAAMPPAVPKEAAVDNTAALLKLKRTIAAS